METKSKRLICNTKEEVLASIASAAAKGKIVVLNFEDASYLFQGMTVPKWLVLDTAKVKIIDHMFLDARVLCSLAKLNTSNVISMVGTFEHAIFNGADLELWDVRNVEAMPFLFRFSPTKPSVSKWCVSKVKNMSGCFYGSPYNGDISAWDMSKCEDISWMFAYSLFNQNIAPWNISKVKSLAGTFAYSIFTGDISPWDISNVETIDHIFAWSIFNGYIKPWNTSKLKTMAGAFFASKFDGDISPWDVRNVINMDYTFFKSIFTGDVSKWTPIKLKTAKMLFVHSLIPSVNEFKYPKKLGKIS